MIDERLPDADAETGYDLVVHEASARTLRQRVLVGAVGVVAAGGLTFSALQAAGGPEASPAPPPPAQVSGHSQDRPVRLDGTWLSAPVTADGLVDFLRSIEHGEHAGRLRGALPSGPNRLALRFGQNAATLSMGGQVVDRHRYVVRDDLLQLVNLREPARLSTYTFDVEQDTLSFTFFGTTEPPIRGVPAMQYQLALYTAVPFERARRQ